MGNVKVVLKDHPDRPQGVRISLPADVPVEELIDELKLKLRLPTQKDGRRMVYKLHHVKSDYTITENETLSDAGVANNDVCLLLEEPGPKASRQVVSSPDKAKPTQPQKSHLKYQTPEYYNDLGLSCLHKGDLDAAIAYFKQAIQISPQTAGYYNNRGLAHKMKGDLDGALNDYNCSIELNNPEPEIPYFNRGVVHYKKGDLDGAIVDFNKAIRHNPKYLESYIWLGAMNRDKGNFEQAIANFKKYREMGGDKHHVEENIEECKKKIKNSKRW